MIPTAKGFSYLIILAKLSPLEAVAIVYLQFLLFFSSRRPVEISKSYAQKKKPRKHLMAKSSFNMWIYLYTYMCHNILDWEDEATWHGCHRVLDNTILTVVKSYNNTLTATLGT
jgi:hypothetical protein